MVCSGKITKKMLHPEITCPYCRIQIGGYKITQNEITHLDVCFTYEAGLSLICQQQEYVKSHIIETDKNGNPEFTEDFKRKIKELEELFYTNPVDVNKETFSCEDFVLAFRECIEWGDVIEEGEKRLDKILIQDVKDLYQQGKNLKEAIRHFVIKS